MLGVVFLGIVHGVVLGIIADQSDTGPADDD
jgi:hypothetical protein